jgi:hypothetical protein
VGWRYLEIVSSSKLERQPIEQRFPRVKRWIVRCSACGRRGLSDSFDWDDPDSTLPGFGSWFKPALRSQYDVLPLDRLGRCATCAAQGASFDLL